MGAAPKIFWTGPNVVIGGLLFGYKENNCVTCCINCNRSKSDRTLEEFKNWIVNLYKNTIINENTSH
jgi:hypothetical protein